MKIALITGGILFVVVAYIFIFALMKASEDEDDRVLHFRDDIPTRITTPVPAPTAWVKYPVPLDDNLQKFITKESMDKGLSPSLVFAIIQHESDFDPNHIGDNGKSYGLMQVMASEHTDRCIELEAVNLLNPYQNVLVGIDFLAELLETKSFDDAMSFYSGGNSEYGAIIKATAEQLEEGVMVVTE